MEIENHPHKTRQFFVYYAHDYHKYNYLGHCNYLFQYNYTKVQVMCEECLNCLHSFPVGYFKVVDFASWTFAPLLLVMLKIGLKKKLKIVKFNKW